MHIFILVCDNKMIPYFSDDLVGGDCIDSGKYIIKKAATIWNYTPPMYDTYFIYPHLELATCVMENVQDIKSWLQLKFS